MKNEPAPIDSTSDPKQARWVRIMRRLLFVAAALTTLAALLYAEENWRGARAWAECKRWLESRGESLDPASIIPPPIPDEKNFAMTPLLRSVVEIRERQDNSASAKNEIAPATQLLLDLPNNIDPAPNNRENGNTLEAWQQYFRRNSSTFPLPPKPQESARDVLDALNKFAPALDELERAAAERPLARFPLAYDIQPSYLMRLGHISVINRGVRVLCLRAKAALALGDIDRSKRDLLLSLRLSESLANEPTLISQLVRAVGSNASVRIIREGMAPRRWSADDLAAFSQVLQRIDLLHGFVLALRGERLLFINPTLDYIESHRGKTLQELAGMTGSQSLAIGWGMRAGWYDQNKVSANVYNQTYLVEAIDLKNRRIDTERFKAGDGFVQSPAWSPYKFFLRLAAPAFGYHGVRLAEAQSSIDEARVACALEEYFLDKGAYPISANALVPAYVDHLPAGVIDGKPIDYARTDDGRYRLSFNPPPGKQTLHAEAWEWKYVSDPKK